MQIRKFIPLLLLALVILFACSVQPQDDSAITVYVTDTGTKYHVATCSYLSSSKIAISLADAKAEGYTPCSVCNPPT